MARKAAAPENEKYRGHQKHENRVNPEKDHVPGHLGYTRANLEGVVSAKPRVSKSRVGTRKNTAMESSKPRRAAPVRATWPAPESMEGRPNTGGRGTNRRGAAASKAARVGGRTAQSSKSSGASSKRAPTKSTRARSNS